MTLNPNEKAVLAFLVPCYDAHYDWGYMSFAPICAATGLDRATVRRACRSLKRKGLTQYLNGLVVESTGEFMGAGYAATEAGVAILDTITATGGEDNNAEM